MSFDPYTVTGPIADALLILDEAAKLLPVEDFYDQHSSLKNLAKQLRALSRRIEGRAEYLRSIKKEKRNVS